MRAVLFLFVLSRAAAVVAPSASFDLHLEQRIGSGASVNFFVARESHLYFAVSDSHGALAIEADPQGNVESSIPLGSGKITGFDVDAAGNIYVLSAGSGLTVYDPNGGVQRTFHPQPAAVAFALVGGKAMLADEAEGLHFAGEEHPGFTLSAWPRPWTLFSLGTDRLGIWSPVGKTLVSLPLQDGVASLHFGSAQRAVAATAGDADGNIYLLEAHTIGGQVEVREFDKDLSPSWIAEYQVPNTVRPSMLGVSAEYVYLVDGAGAIEVYNREVVSHARVRANDNPELLSALTPLTQAAEKTGYRGSIRIKMDVSESGNPTNIRVESPAFLESNAEVISYIQALKFRPQIKGGIAVSSTALVLVETR
jgi:hypothetical protein